jgi:hypothetical protein
MKLGKLVSDSSFGVSLRSLMKAPGLPPKTMFALRGIAKVVVEESSKYDEIRKEIIEEFAERDEKGEMVKITPDSVKIIPAKIKEMEAKLKALADIDIKIPHIKFEDLGETPTVTAEDLFHLDFIVE